MKPFNPLYTFHSLWENFKALTKKMFRKDTGELVIKDKVEFANDVQDFENIVDKDGHKRFIEADIPTKTIEGVTFTYAKWSLSGTHLMFVLAGNIASGTAITDGDFTNQIQLPEWVFAKIYPTFSSVVELKQIKCYATNWSTQDMAFTLRMGTTGMIIQENTTVTLNADRGFRVQFDLLIDNAESE